MLNIGSTTIVPFTISSAAGSSATDRFYVVFKQGAVLPVSLTSIRAYQNNTAVEVEWTTRQEINLSHYEVERSSNAQNFTKIGSQAATNSDLVSQYALSDHQPLVGLNYYRVKIIDRTGQSSYSSIVKINTGKGVSSQITVSPNPVTGNNLTLQFTNLEQGSYSIALTNKLGQVIERKTLEHKGGSATESIELSGGLAKGVYQLTVRGKGSVVTKQVIRN